LSEKYGGTDDFELEDLQTDWISHFCKVSLEIIDQAREEMLKNATVKTGLNRRAMTISIPVSI
jgi:hypothetical protein